LSAGNRIEFNSKCGSALQKADLEYFVLSQNSDSVAESEVRCRGDDEDISTPKQRLKAIIV
jgi:hypothetical protein